MTPEKRFVDLDPSKSLIQHLKEQSQLVLQLQNKLPQWSDETQSYVLNFNGRVSLASVKNFQIVHPNDLEHVVLQFGKVTQNEFSVDIQYPFSILLGFGIVLTAFESKVACE
ncbi:tubby C-terminal-like domain-containing protein [Gorgonomyces haynaldii]|nr:tubby C-terminal-like domain-containing protein [Gorgonomyces haynaldii]